MKVLVTGANGQLGFDVCRELARLGIEREGVDIGHFDLTDAQQTQAYIARRRPDAVVHCAAYTAVDRAESERERCHAVNVDGTVHVADACRETGAKMVYISTDYVFDGRGDEPFEADSPKHPINHYGLTKSLGEEEVVKRLAKHFVVRTSWVFGENGGNFVRTMLRLGAEMESLNVVMDQIGSPTYTFDLAKLLCRMLQTEQYGIYHATNEGICSWFEFASAIMEEARLRCRVLPIPSGEYPTAAKRPMNSRLSKASLDAAGFDRLPHWRDALKRYIASVQAPEENA
jgi:dTDP-4-dehydrorhamnose reductase